MRQSKLLSSFQDPHLASEACLVEQVPPSPTDRPPQRLAATLRGRQRAIASRGRLRAVPELG